MLATSNISMGLENWMKTPAALAPETPADPQPQAARSSAPALDGKVQYNPVLNYDRDAQVVLVQIIDPATGEVDRQYPSEKKLEAYQKAMEEQQEALPTPETPVGLDDVPGHTPARSNEAGGLDIDPGQSTRERSLVA